MLFDFYYFKISFILKESSSFIFVLHVFQIARTKAEILGAINVARRWAKAEFYEEQNKENARSKIAKKFEFWTIKTLMKLLPSECSVIKDFPIQLPNIEGKKKVHFVKVKTPARIDFAGGWTDTPPITYDLDDPRVLNASILVDGKRPITVEIRKLLHIPGIWIQTEDNGLKCFKSKKEIFENAKKPNTAGSLICAVIIVSGIFESDRKSMDLETAEILESNYHNRDKICRGLNSDKRSVDVEMTDISNINDIKKEIFKGSKSIKRPMNCGKTNAKKFRYEENGNSNVFKCSKSMEFETVGISREFDFGDDETCGLLITSHSDLPHGSGLGTSSILSGAVLAGIWTLFGKQFEDRNLIKAVSFKS